MLRTRVGFSDGAEVVRVEFDPKVTSYEDLLALFWSAHKETGPNNSRLYQKGIFYHNEEQKKRAEASLRNQQKKNSLKITTTIERAQFRSGPEHDQKYYLRNNAKLWSEFKKQYPKTREITDSPAAAKVNGYLGGNSDKSHFKAHARLLGLSESARKFLAGKVPKKARHFVPKCELPK